MTKYEFYKSPALKFSMCMSTYVCLLYLKNYKTVFPFKMIAL